MFSKAILRRGGLYTLIYLQTSLYQSHLSKGCFTGRITYDVNALKPFKFDFRLLVTDSRNLTSKFYPALT